MIQEPMIQDLLFRSHHEELTRRAAAEAQSAEAWRVRRALRPTAAGMRPAAGAGHAPGAWCWLFDRLPARARRHSAA